MKLKTDIWIIKIIRRLPYFIRLLPFVHSYYINYLLKSTPKGDLEILEKYFKGEIIL